MADSPAYASACQSLKAELTSIVDRFDTFNVIDIWRSASILHEEIFSVTDLTIIRLRQLNNIKIVPDVYEIYAEALTNLLLKVNHKAFSSLTSGFHNLTPPS